jgi:hypothetical protein
VYFLLGSVPLLILKHDNPMDGSFIRVFFNLYYRMAALVGTAAAFSYAFTDRAWFAVGAAFIAMLSVFLRRTIISKMDLIRAQIPTDNLEAIPEFRKIHLVAVVISLAQLIVVICSLMVFKL